ncbi:Uncharacterized protein FKW44_018863, partial [Caligus rogercresseyi]
MAANLTSRIREREAEFAKQVQERDEQLPASRSVLNPEQETKRLLQWPHAQQEKNVKEEGAPHAGAAPSMATDSLQRNNGVDLKQQLNSLDGLQQEHKIVELQFKEKEEACKELMNSLKRKSALCHDLEAQLARVIQQNMNSPLPTAICKNECNELKSTLVKVESECVTAKSEVHNLSGKMHRAAENRREIERQHKEALE